MRRSSFIAAVFTLALCGCNKVDNLESNEKTAAPTVYHLNIQASLDPETKGVTFDPDGSHISTQFKTTDIVYIYNETKKAMARYLDENWDEVFVEEKYLPTAIHPSNISASGSGCTLEGELSFWKWNGNDWESVTIDDEDTYSLFYQMNYPEYDPGEPLYVYVWQEGSAESASEFDFAQASGFTMTKSGTSLIVPDGVQFTNLQSMFRQHLTFVKGGVTVNPAPIASIDVNTAKTTFVANYTPTVEPDFWYFTTNGFRINNPDITDGDIFLSLAFDYTEQSADGDQLLLTACDGERNIYQGAKNVPKGGFQKSKYYYGDMPMLWKYKEVKPNVTRADGGDEDELVPEKWKYTIQSPSYPDPVVFTISGNSAGYYFRIPADAEITLGGGGIAAYSGVDPLIFVDEGLTISLASDYTIDCRGYKSAIWADCGDLKLNTTGGTSYTLTVIANNPAYRGLFGNSNYTKSSDDPSDLADVNFTVVLTSTLPGPDEDKDGNPDYYTWVYTVSKL